MSESFPNVAPILPPKGEIPEGYSLMVRKWSYPEYRIGETVEIDGERIKKMLTLDINIPRAGFAAAVNAEATGSEAAKKAFVKNYPCEHSCPGCFNNAELMNPIMTVGEALNVIDQARKLGLESIKFLGPGELLSNPDLFAILDELAKRDITVGIFTKASMMGFDPLAMHYHGIGSEELTRRLTSYPNTTFLVSATSFDPELENRFVPQNLREFREQFDHHAARNLALERLTALGMNSDLLDQRLAIACAPITSGNVDRMLEYYQWSTERNIPIYLPPTMVSGKGHRLIAKSANDLKFEEDYIEMAARVYAWGIKRGVMTPEQLHHEGAASYVGIAPCNQLTHGLYIHYDGQVWRCPGNDTPDFVVHKNVRAEPLVEIWRASKNYEENRYNNGCVKDGVSLPMRFYDEVPRRVQNLLAA